MIRFRIRELMGRWEVENAERLTLEDLAKGTKISTQVLYRLIDPNSDYATSSRHIEAICRFFGVTPNELLFFDPPVGQESQERSSNRGQEGDRQ